MARRLTDKDKQRLAEARLRELSLGRKSKAMELHKSGPCNSQLVTLIPTLLQGKAEKSNKRIKRDKSIGMAKAMAYGIKIGLLEKESKI